MFNIILNICEEALNQLLLAHTTVKNDMYRLC